MVKTKKAKSKLMTVQEWEQFLQEFIIMKEEIRIMKDIIKNKLGIEVKVF